MTAPKRPAGETLPLPLFELVALLVAMTSVVALAIDMMLPALDDIAGDLGRLSPKISGVIEIVDQMTRDRLGARIAEGQGDLVGQVVG